MTGDADLLALERQASETGDRQRLDVELWRLGRGPEPIGRWEDAPPWVESRGLYRHAKTGIELMRVPGGDVLCATCEGRGRLTRETGPMLLFVSTEPCDDCRGNGRRAIAPFFVGRYPVTKAQAFAWASEAGVRAIYRTELAHHPAVNVSHVDALAFCAFAGLRLPSAIEWRWAALGGYAQFIECNGCGGSPTIHRDGCRGNPRRFPYGNDPPSRERCVWAGYNGNGIRYEQWNANSPPFAVSIPALPPQSTMPVVEPKIVDRAPRSDIISTVDVSHLESRLSPARPLGASWCGALDMAGNVWEWTSDSKALGGSFRTHLELANGIFSGSEWFELEARDDIGFRVALSCPVLT